ncbi:DUF1801 domain-containing protein [Leptothoe spongobia]|uniref:DUF1801 domain-containing protein n=1 Tax=Leptothoe spongobia TAU-MAC 1115 TaxID=1967444 RepID=A0A947GRW5_9CYAN|nr:DUF1801 domain-containing protein [Leptothoe spongobia]MBT9317666.1 DUF1801 domain-containing protein [Leptothoe spongobia TAU-MAC 1115]
MQYDVNTPDEYLGLLSDDWRKEKLLALREIICAQAPDIVESIKYKMLSYGDDSGSVFHLNAQKNYVSLYVGNIDTIDPAGELTQNLNRGKGCIRFTKSVAISQTQIDVFIEKAIALWRQGDDLGC